MRRDKNECAGPVMEGLWPLPLLLSLAVLVLPCHPLPGPDCSVCPEPQKAETPCLTCFNDFASSIGCVWNGPGNHLGERCVLQAELERSTMLKTSCILEATEGLGTLWSCPLVFLDNVKRNPVKFRRLDTVTINLSCGKYSVVHSTYEPHLCVKMHPPSEPVIAKANISWSLGSPHSRMIRDYHFELQFKPSEELWESPNAVSRNLLDRQMSAELAEDDLERGRLYEARVRVRPAETSGNSLKGVWSSWSPTALWRSEVGRSPVIDTSSSFPGMGPELQVTLGLVTAAVAVMVLITCNYHRAGWIHKLKLQHVPNPSTYFLPLSSVHGGNFQKWLSPMFAPESFVVSRSSEDVSPVEVSKAKDVSALLDDSKHASRPAEQRDSKHASRPAEQRDSSSKPPSSYDLELCPGYTSYKFRAGDSGAGGGGGGEEGAEPENAPLQICCSYEQLGGESRPLDPGCGEHNEEEEGQTEEGPEEIDTLPPLPILPISVPGPAPTSAIPLPPHLPSTPLLMFPFHNFGSDTVPGSSNISGPLDGAIGRALFTELAPSSGDYMSVQSARSNNSV